MRIIVHTGKGGVGKTSISAATALRCAEGFFPIRHSPLHYAAIRIPGLIVAQMEIERTYVPFTECGFKAST